MEKLERKETATRTRMIINGMRKPRIVSILRSLGEKRRSQSVTFVESRTSEDNFLKLAWKKETTPLQRLYVITVYLAKKLHTT